MKSRREGQIHYPSEVQLGELKTQKPGSGNKTELDSDRRCSAQRICVEGVSEARQGPEATEGPL